VQQVDDVMPDDSEVAVQDAVDTEEAPDAADGSKTDDDQSQNAEKELVVQTDEAGNPIMKKDVVNFVFDEEDETETNDKAEVAGSAQIDLDQNEEDQDDDDVLQADGMMEEEIIGQPSDALNPGKEKIYDDNSPLKWWMVMVPIAVVIVVIVMVLLCYWFRVGLGVCGVYSAQKEEPEYAPVAQEEEPQYGSFGNAYDDHNFYTQDRDDY